MRLDETLVRERAYTLWQRDGAVEGCSERYWFQAESELGLKPKPTLGEPLPAPAAGAAKGRPRKRSRPEARTR